MKTIRIAILTACIISIGCTSKVDYSEVIAEAQHIIDEIEAERERDTQDDEGELEIINDPVPPVQANPEPESPTSPEPEDSGEEDILYLPVADGNCEGIPTWRKEIEPQFNQIEPQLSVEGSEMGTFLWKPKSDHGSTVVLVVNNDEVNSDSVRVKVFGKNGDFVGNTETANNLYNRRSNYVPTNTRGKRFCYGRMTFRLNKTVAQLRRKAPLKVCFELVGGTPIKIDGKRCQKISRVNKRCGVLLSGESRCT